MDSARKKKEENLNRELVLTKRENLNRELVLTKPKQADDLRGCTLGNPSLARQMHFSTRRHSLYIIEFKLRRDQKQTIILYECKAGAAGK